MADEAAKRRAARRKKILENPEERLQRLFGKSKDADYVTPSFEDIDLMKSDSSKETSEINKCSQENDVKPITFSNRNQRLDLDPSEIFKNLDDSVLSEMEISQELIQSKETFQNSSPKINSLSSSTVNNYHFPKILTESRTYNRPKVDGIKNATKFDSLPLWLSFGFIRNLICLLFGIIVRVLLHLEMNFFLAKSIFFHLILLELGLTSYEYFYVDHRSSNQGMVGGAVSAGLMLSGIPNSFVTKVVTIINLCSRLFEDTILYLFTFFTIHWFLESF